jgi:hypothetical protein
LVGFSRHGRSSRQLIEKFAQLCGGFESGNGIELLERWRTHSTGSTVFGLRIPVLRLEIQPMLRTPPNWWEVAWVLLGGGATLVLTGIIIPKGEITNPDCVFCPEEKIEYKNDGIKSTLGLTGVLSMIGSIPFFIASKKNNKRAMSFAFKNETATQLVKNNLVCRPLPSLNLKISL